MSRQIDGVSQKSEEFKPKPVAEHRPGEVYRPKGALNERADDKAVLKKNTFVEAKQDAEHHAENDKISKKVSPRAQKLRFYYKIGAGVAVLALAIIAWQYWGRDFVALQSKDPNTKPVAKVYDSYITQKQLSDATDNQKKLNNALYSDKKTTNSEEDAYNDLLLERALQREAAQRSISINDTDINSQIDKAKQNRDELLKFAMQAGVSDEAALRWYRIAAYQDKLAKYLLDTRDVRQYAVRWDYSQSHGTDIISKGAEFDAFQAQAKEKLRQVVEAPLKSGQKYDDFKSRIDLDFDQTNSEYQPLNVLSRTIKGMNRKGNSTFQEGAKDWGAIEGLNSVGQYSAITRSDGGYYAIYQLLERNTGSYKSWDDYTNAVRRGAKKFARADLGNSLIAIHDTRNRCDVEQATGYEKVLSYLGVGQAQAAACGSLHWNVFIGRVTNQFGVPIAGATVKIEPRNPGVVNYCSGNTSGSYGTDGAGNWRSDDRFSCFMQWRAVYTAPNCFPLARDLLNPGTNNGTINAGSVSLLCGAVGNSPPFVKASVDCNTGRITGEAYDVNSIWGPSQATFVGFLYSGYTGNPSNPGPTGLPGGTRAGETNVFGTGWHLFDDPGAQFKALGNNPAFLTGLGGFNVPIPPTVASRNLRDGNTYSYIALAMDYPSGNYVRSGDQSISYSRCQLNYDIFGDKSYDGAPSTPAPDLAAGRVWADGGNPQTFTQPWGLYGLSRNADHTIHADPINNWEPYAYKLCYDGNIDCGSPKEFGTAVTIPSGLSVDATQPRIRWYYRPLASKIQFQARIDNGGTYLNPCSYAATDYRYGLCGKPSVAINYTGGAYTDLGRTYTTNAGPIAVSGAQNQADFSGQYPGVYGFAASNTPPGWKFDGFCTPGGSGCTPVPTTDVGANGTNTIYMKYVSDITLPVLTVSCTGISGLVSGTVQNVKVELFLQDTWGVAVPKSLGQQSGKSFNFNSLDDYRDGQVRKITFAVTYDNLNGSGSRQTTTIDPGRNHSCANVAQCVSNNIDAVFQGGAGDAGTNYKVKFVMKNPANLANSDWRKTWATGSGEHMLSLVGTDKGNWDATGLVLGENGNPDTVKQGDGDYTFIVNLKSKGALGTTTKIELQMSFARADGTVIPFGAVCGNSVKLRSFYGPWLRVQNGSTSALRKITGQPAGARGMYSDDINLETAYIVSSVLETNNFCSSNSYLLGQGTSAGTGSCSGGLYKIATIAPIDNLYGIVSDKAATGTCVVANGYPADKTPSIPTERYAASTSNLPPGGIVSLGGNANTAIPTNAPCPRFFTMSGGALSTTTLQPGQATLIVDGNLSINGNITAANLTNIGGYKLDGDLGDIAKSVASLAIVVKGNVTIASGVTNIDAMVYSTGQINTCDKYYAGTTGLKSSVEAQQCNSKLTVRGGLYADGGFLLGRNFYQYNRTTPNYSVAGFDYQAGGYFGGPAEDVIGNGLGFFLTPPGLDNLSRGDYGKPVFIQGDFTPRF